MKKGTYMKIAAGILVVLLVWWFLRMRAAGSRKIIVSQMPVIPTDITGMDDDLYETVPPPTIVSATAAPKEAYSEWVPEEFEEYSDVQFKADLLE